MSQIILLNGSPSGEKATSRIFLTEMEKRLMERGHRIRYGSMTLHPSRQNDPEMLDSFIRSDAMILSFPLYAYGVPAPMVKWMEELHNHIETTGADVTRIKIYGIVNSGYYHPEVNREAVRIIQLFCHHTGMQFRKGIQVGGGLVVAMMRKVPLINHKLKVAFGKILNDLESESSSTPLPSTLIRPVIPRRIMNFMKDSEWSKQFMKKRENRKRRKA